MLDYELVNMFADRPFTGSALAVVRPDEDLSAQAMQAIAAELGAIETAFVLPPASPKATYRVRVFTPVAESPFGGHSSIGNAATLVRLGAVAAGPVTQECGLALQPLLASADGATMIGRAALVEDELDTSRSLDVVGLRYTDLADARPRMAGFGTPFAFLPVRRSALAEVSVDGARLLAAGLPAVCVFGWDPTLRLARARVFAPGFGIPEDAACAPIGMALGAWLFGAGLLPASDGRHGYTIRQGVEMGRASTLSGTIVVRGGRVTEGRVTGRVAHVASGRIARP